MALLRATAIVLLFAHVASAQYRVDSWTTEQGLPQNSVHAIVQTKDGYLWLGTFGGLVRFDGLAFTVIAGGADSRFLSNRIRSIHEGRSGALWVGTERGGLSRFANGSVTTYTRQHGLPTDNIRYVYEDRIGRVWIATGSGLVRFENGQFTTYSTKNGFPSDAIWRIVEDPSGTLLIATGEGLVTFRDGQFVLAIGPAQGLRDPFVRSVVVSRDGGWWLGLGRAGLAYVVGQEVTLYTREQGLPSNNVRDLFEDHTGALWVATDAGVARLTRDLEDPRPPSRAAIVTVSRHTGLSDDMVNALLEDREGNLWAGTNTGGLNRLKRRTVVALRREDGLAGDAIVPITEDATGAVWIGATCGGLSRYAGGAFTTYKTIGDTKNDCVWSLLAARDGSIWIGTWGGSLTRFYEGRFTTLTPANSGLSNAAVLSLHEGADGALWIGTDGGLNRLKDNVFTLYHRANGLVYDDVRFITEDREGALWVGTSGGVSRLADGRFTNYTIENGLSHNFVRAIHQTADGAMWFGTYGGGLNRLKDGRFTHYTTANGLFEDIVSRILEDDRGNFWMSGNKGIARVSRAELDAVAEGRAASISPVVYGVADGMTSSECNGGGQPAGWKMRDGTLWFPTARGVAEIDPSHIESNPTPPPVMIERALVNRNAVDLHSTVEVPPGASDVEIQFTGLSFSAPERVRFMYKLEGLADEWTSVGTRRFAYYSHLPPGEYTFRVIAANPDGVWNTTGASIQLRIVPPFYRTWWFTVVLGAGLLAVVFVAYERRISGLTRAKQAQETFSRRLIESQEAERQRIAAELHDSLSQTLVVIKNRAVLSLQAPDDHERAMEQLDEIAEASSAAIDEVREISYNLRPYHLDRLGLTQAIGAMLDRVASAHRLTITRTLDPLDGLFAADAEINIYRIVQEAVNNIVRHARATEFQVTIRHQAGRVEIVISDNGCGFASDRPSPGGGFGLVGMTERAHLLGAELSIQSAPGQGTTVRLAIGVNEGHGPQDSRTHRG